MNLHLSFHTLITLAYTIPNIYLFLRIRQRFIEKGFRVWYTLIYLILVLIYPARTTRKDRHKSSASDLFRACGLLKVAGGINLKIRFSSRKMSNASIERKRYRKKGRDRTFM